MLPGLVGIAFLTLLAFGLHHCLARSKHNICGALGFFVIVGAAATVSVWHQVVLSPVAFRPVDLTGKVAVVTGGTSGIGLETARVLAEWNATVVLPARNLEKGARVQAAIEATLPAGSTGSVRVLHCDLASLKSVRSFAEEFLAAGDDGRSGAAELDMLILNAGVAGCDTCDLQTTEDGYEVVMQANHLSHFLLTELLLPALRRCATRSGEARVVHVSSVMHRMGELSRAGIEAGNADAATMRLGGAAYADAELMQLLYSNALDRREGAAGTGVSSVSVHPGFVWSDLDRDGGPIGHAVRFVRAGAARPTVDGAVTQVTAATLPDAPWLKGARAGKRGVYLEDHCIMRDCETTCAVCPGAAEGGGVQPSEAGDDVELQDWLVETSARLVGIAFQ